MDDDEEEPRGRSHREGSSGDTGGGREAERANRRICALFDACRGAGTPRGVRDAAVLSVLYGANVPRERALQLPVGAWDPTTGRLETPGADPPARAAVEGAREALAAWLELRGGADGPLFCPLPDGAPDPGRPMDPGDVDRLLARWAREAGVEDVRPAAFRRLYRSPWWRAAGSS